MQRKLTESLSLAEVTQYGGPLSLRLQPHDSSVCYGATIHITLCCAGCVPVEVEVSHVEVITCKCSAVVHLFRSSCALGGPLAFLRSRVFLIGDMPRS